MYNDSSKALCFLQFSVHGGGITVQPSPKYVHRPRFTQKPTNQFPRGSLKTLPPPSAPGFPFEAPSRFSFTHPSGRVCQLIKISVRTTGSTLNCRLPPFLKASTISTAFNFMRSTGFLFSWSNYFCLFYLNNCLFYFNFFY